MTIRGPSSLATQLAMVMALAVLAAAIVQLTVLLVERNRTGFIEASGPAITRFADLSSEAISRDWTRFDDEAARPIRRRGARLAISSDNFIVEWKMARHRQLERRLQRALADIGHPEITVMAATRILSEGDRIRPGSINRPAIGPSDRKIREIVLASELAPGRWMSGAYLAPVPPNDEFGRLFLGVVVAVGCVLGAAIWMSARLVRPLGELASAAGRLGNSPSPQALAVRGPKEIRRTLSAFNGMSARVSELLREKDVMLGALGHDLRTPLASLRIRVESMEPETEREKAIQTIEETTRLLESILDFARTGKASESVEAIELQTMLGQLVEDYQARGKPVTLLPTNGGVITIKSNEDLLRRLLRNLIDNACQHGEHVGIELHRTKSGAAVTVTDDGPGIPDDQLELVKQPFYRTDASRNRRVGGSGLGLALAETIVRTLGGTLALSNTRPHGLLAQVNLPSNFLDSPEQ